MSGFVVLVEFTVKAEAFPKFLEEMRENARGSLAEEPGCRQFDISLPQKRQNTVVLYEVYDDRAAFDAHLARPAVAAFLASIKPVVEQQQIQFLERDLP